MTEVGVGAESILIVRTEVAPEPEDVEESEGDEDAVD